MKRRTFLCTTGITALGALLPKISLAAGSPDVSTEKETFEWATPELTFAYEVSEQKLRQRTVLPSRMAPGKIAPKVSSGVETAIQCSGENSPDQGMKQGSGQPGIRLLFKGKHEESTGKGRRLVLSQADPILGIEVDSFYESFEGIPVVRRWTRVTNSGSAPIGIEFLSSAMLHSLADAQNYEDELVIQGNGIPCALPSWALSRTTGPVGQRRRRAALAAGPQRSIFPWPWWKTHAWA